MQGFDAQGIDGGMPAQHTRQLQNMDKEKKNFDRNFTIVSSIVIASAILITLCSILVCCGFCGTACYCARYAQRKQKAHQYENAQEQAAFYAGTMPPPYAAPQNAGAMEPIYPVGQNAIDTASPYAAGQPADGMKPPYGATPQMAAPY